MGFFFLDQTMNCSAVTVLQVGCLFSQ